MSTKARLMVTTWHPKDEDREFWARLGFRIGVGVAIRMHTGINPSDYMVTEVTQTIMKGKG